MANTFKFGNGQWATKVGSTLAYNDENGNFKPLPFDFTRASSATRVNKQGLIETVGSNEPRVDYLDNADGHLLLEPSRTNIVPRSEDLDTGWSKLNVTIANNETTSPDGNISAGLVTVTSTSGSHANYDTFATSTTPSVSHYISCFVKKSTTRYIRLVEGYSSATLNFDLDNGEIVSLSGGSSNSILQDFGNGWYRIGFQFTSNVTGDLQFALYLNNNSNSASYAGAGEAVYLWGAQIELGYLTSYIPTSGSAGGVTRVAEAASQTPPSGIIGQTEGSVYVELNINNIGTNFIFSIDDGGASDFIILDTNSIGELDLQVRQSSGSITTIISGSALIEGSNKMAVRYKSGDYSLYLNGVLQGTSASTLFPSGTISRVSVGGNSSYGYLSNSANDFKLYDTALSNTELQQLTS
jgi:hypothetical protein